MLNKHCDTINIVSKSLMERLISRSYRCFIRDAILDKGIFTPLTTIQKQSGGVKAIEYEQNLGYIQKGLKFYRMSIQEKMRNFINSKDELLEEAIKFTNYMESVVLSRIPAVTILNAIIHNVNFPIEH